MAEPEEPASPVRLEAPLVALGLAVGFLSSWCGIGGGLFAVPLLHLTRGLELKRAVGSALPLVLATALAATLVELLGAEPSLRWPVVLPLVAGVLIGAPLGFAALQRIEVGLLRRLFVVVLLAAAWRILAAEAGDARAAAAVEPRAVALLVALIGLGGGFLSPLLGIGGGLLMVPGLFLLVGLSFEEARASSLCAAVFGAARSLALHARAARIAWRPATSLGLGALGGAAAGVWVLTRYGLIAQARTLLALVLVLVALRFALEAFRAART